ncbi:MAG: hypothetical protein HY320_04645 [Armatimonadetes bacterium]|nr:hypothetical protein [Armatimonadota bacterium]
MRRAKGEHPDLPDELLERLERERRAGEMDTAMYSGSDDTPEIAIGERFAGELTPEEALRALTAGPERHRSVRTAGKSRTPGRAERTE